MKFFIVLTLLVLISLGCSRDPQPEHCRIADKVMTRFVRNVERRHGLFCTSYGGAFMKQINEVYLGFDTLGPKSKDELRVIMVVIVEEFLERVNTNNEIREYLVNYPFNVSNLKFRVCLWDENRESIKNKGSGKDLLYGTLLMKNKIFYEIKNEEKAPLQNVYEETYDEALEIVRKQHPELLPKAG